MGVPLPLGLKSPTAWIERVRATYPPGYASLVALLLAYLDGRGGSDLAAQILAVFPVTGPKMRPLGFALVERAAEAKALVYDGSPEFGLETMDGNPVETTAAGTSFADVLEDADFLDVVKRADERTVPSRLVFVRVAWDDVARRVRLDLFDPTVVHPLYDPDRPSLKSAEGVLLDLVPVDGVNRHELWTAIVNEAGETVDARNLILDPKGEILSVPGETPDNPYRGPDGIPDGEGAPAGRYPLLPLVAFGDLNAGPWPLPRQTLLDAQRGVNLKLTNAGHIALLSGWGQWVDEKAEGAADWGGSASKGGSEASRLGRGQSAPVSSEVVLGPDVVVSPPAGHTLKNVPIAANMADLRSDIESFLRQACVSEGIPAHELVDTAQVASGVALLMQQAPLERYREKRLPTFQRSTCDLIDLIRIVWNTHHEPQDRFVAAGGVRPVFKPDAFRIARDPLQVADVATRKKALGLHSPAEIRAEMDDSSVEEAQAALDLTKAERSAAVPVVPRMFPSPLTQARGAAPVVEDVEDDAEA